MTTFIDESKILTDEQIEIIAESIDEVTSESESIKMISEMPSNNGIEENPNPEDGEYKMMNIEIDPNTGEHKITGNESSLDDEETFEEMCERIENSDINVDADVEITESDITEYLDDKNNGSFFHELVEGTEITPADIKVLLSIVNRRKNREEFNVYKAYPESIRNMIDKYCIEGGIVGNSNEAKMFRNTISEQLIEEFITNISISKTFDDFNKELETLFAKGSNEIAESIIGYTEDRNKQYREYAEKMEDEEKKAALIAILDSIDEAYNLTGLKEYAKKCKIKNYDLENPSRSFDRFNGKYKDSPYNIYAIEMASTILFRNINIGLEEDKMFTDKQVIAFFIAFCKQTLNYSPEVTTEHAYMYYLIYNIVLMDMNKGERKDISDKFLSNIKEVIYNLMERNSNI